MKETAALFDELFGDLNPAQASAGLPLPFQTGRLELEITFRSTAELKRSYFLRAGVDGLAICTDQKLVPGQVIGVKLQVPGWNPSLDLDGEVGWVKGPAVGLLFRTLRPADRERLKAIHGEKLLPTWLRRLLGGTEVPTPSIRVVQPLDSIVFEAKASLALDLAAKELTDAGYRIARQFSASTNPSLMVLDVPAARRLKPSAAAVPVILLQGPGAMPSDLIDIGPAAFLTVPFSPDALVSAVRRLAARPKQPV
jgi:hypothetical protein